MLLQTPAFFTHESLHSLFSDDDSDDSDDSDDDNDSDDDQNLPESPNQVKNKEDDVDKSKDKDVSDKEATVGGQNNQKQSKKPGGKYPETHPCPIISAIQIQFSEHFFYKHLLRALLCFIRVHCKYRTMASTENCEYKVQKFS